MARHAKPLGAAAILALLLAGCTGPTVSDLPPATADVEVQQENRDADPADEFLVLVTVRDENRQPTTCECTMNFAVSRFDYNNLTTHWDEVAEAEVTEDDFGAWHRSFLGDNEEWVAYGHVLDDDELPCQETLRVSIYTDYLDRALRTETETPYC